jgi:glyoxylase-like metal-dependent hydrolase (beta-lactamase superfamily II)
MQPRAVLAPNASPMTLTGTTTYLVGRAEVAIIDPGSDDPSHLDALAAETPGARSIRILITHNHPDHAAGARLLARRVDARVFSLGSGTLRDGAVIPTDEGALTAIATPGHAPDHVAFHWPAASAIFCGDLMMGGLDTAVVAAPEGDIGQYLASLDRLRSLRAHTIYPSHGPAFTDADSAIARYIAHREEREHQVIAAMTGGARDLDSLTDAVYGTPLDPALREFARAAIQAYVAHLYATGRLPEED